MTGKGLILLIAPEHHIIASRLVPPQGSTARHVTVARLWGKRQGSGRGLGGPASRRLLVQGAWGSKAPGQQIDLGAEQGGLGGWSLSAGAVGRRVILYPS